MHYTYYTPAVHIHLICAYTYTGVLDLQACAVTHVHAPPSFIDTIDRMLWLCDCMCGCVLACVLVCIGVCVFSYHTYTLDTQEIGVCLVLVCTMQIHLYKSTPTHTQQPHRHPLTCPAWHPDTAAGMA